MKVGLKLYTTDDVGMIEKRDYADYFEVYVVPGKPFEQLKDFDHEYVIHAPHAHEGVNLASKHAQKFSIDAMRYALKAADALNAKWVVMHSGYVKDGEGGQDMTLETLKQSLEELNDNRIILENMPLTPKGDSYFGYDYKTLKELSSLGFNKRICLDLSHAQISSVTLGKTEDWIIDGLLKLDVKMFHLCDGKLGSTKDMHLSLFDGDYALEKYKRIIDSSFCRMVTLETEHVVDQKGIIKQKNEVEWLKS